MTDLNKKLEELALEAALRYYFCNVDEVTWPEDPIGLLQSGKFENGCDEDNSNHREMIVWEPFEGEETDDLLDLIGSMQESCFRYMNRAIELYKENKR